MDQVLRSDCIDLEIGFFFHGLCHARQMEHLIDTFDGLFEGSLILTITVNGLDG
jgi:hypothetical protein